jgi:YcxB-like protein
MARTLDSPSKETMDAGHPATLVTSEHTYRFLWDRAEYRRANKAILSHAMLAPWLRIALRAFMWVIGIGLGLWLAATLLAGNWPALARSTPWLVLIVGWFLFLRYGTAWLSIRAWEKRHPPGAREITVSIGENGFYTASHPGELRLKWDALLQVVATEEFILFYITWQIAHYLPKRAVPASDFESLWALLKAAKRERFTVAGPLQPRAV